MGKANTLYEYIYRETALNDKILVLVSTVWAEKKQQNHICEGFPEQAQTPCETFPALGENKMPSQTYAFFDIISVFSLLYLSPVTC